MDDMETTLVFEILEGRRECWNRGQLATQRTVWAQSQDAPFEVGKKLNCGVRTRLDVGGQSLVKKSLQG